MTTKSKYLTIIIGISLLLSMLLPVHAQNDEITFPKFQVETQTFETNEKKDLYLKSENYHGLIPHSLKFSEDMQQTDYFETNPPTSKGVRSKDVTFQDQDPGIMQFMNGTQKNSTKLEYRRSYFNLLQTKGEGSKIQLNAGKTYTFSLSVSDTTPIFIRVLASQVPGTGASNVFSLKTTSIGPDGNINSNTIFVTQNIKNYIPIIPQQTGKYTFTIETSKNIILQEFAIEQDPDINEIQRSYTQSYEGEETISQFIRINPGNNQMKVWDLNSIIYQSQFLVESGTYVSPGSISLYLFTGMGQSPLSTGMSNLNTIITSNQPIYVAVIVTPPNPEDPNIRKAQQDDLIEGIDVELTFSAEKHSIEKLPINTNFETVIDKSYQQDGTNFYTFSTDQTVLVGLNSTTYSSPVTFQPLDDEMDNVDLDPDTENVRYDPTDNAAVLEPGDYIISLPSENKFRFSVINPEPFTLGQDMTSTRTFQNVSFYYLPPGEYSQDLLNFTYLDQKNQTATYDFTYFNTDGNHVQDLSVTFEHYYDNITGMEINNNTQFVSSISQNIHGSYLRVGVSGNAQYNTTGHLVTTNNKTLSSTLKMTRLNQYRIDDENDPSKQFYFNSIDATSPISHDLNGSISDIRDFINFTTIENRAYRLIIETTNRTLDNFQLYSTNTQQWLQTQIAYNSYDKNISGIIHHFYELEFASTIENVFGLQLDYSGNVANGTTKIMFQPFSVQSFPELSIPSLADQPIGETGFDWVQAGIIAGAVVGGLAIIGAIVYFLKRQGII